MALCWEQAPVLGTTYWTGTVFFFYEAIVPIHIDGSYRSFQLHTFIRNYCNVKQFKYTTLEWGEWFEALWQINWIANIAVAPSKSPILWVNRCLRKRRAGSEVGTWIASSRSSISSPGKPTGEGADVGGGVVVVVDVVVLVLGNISGKV